MDWILPDKLAVTSRTVAYDGLVTHNLRVTDYPIVYPMHGAMPFLTG